MLRIKTKIGEGKVYTLFEYGRWITMTLYLNKQTNRQTSASVEANNLYEAGENHIAYALDLREYYNQQGIVDEKQS
jgi:hypothetical protein